MRRISKAQKALSCMLVFMMVCTMSFVPASALAENAETNLGSAQEAPSTNDVTTNQSEDNDTSSKADEPKTGKNESTPASNEATPNPATNNAAAQPTITENKPQVAPLEFPATGMTVSFDKSAGNKPAEVVSFTSADQKLETRGCYDVGSSFTKKYFIGWSEDKNWSAASSSKLHFATDTIGDVFPNGADSTKTLYAIYIGAFDLATMPLTGNIHISKEQTAEDVVPDNKAKQSTGFGTEESKDGSFYYNPDNDKNNLSLDVNFDFNKNLAYLTYLNPGGVMSNSGTWSDGPKEGASYSHVDLHINFDERVTLADTFKFTFTSYNFKPSYILDEDYNILASGLSNNVVTNDPTTLIEFQPNGKKSFILRCTIRHDGNAKNALVGTPEQVAADMLIRSASPDNMWIDKDLARSMALDETIPPLLFSGYIDGIAKASFLVRSIIATHADPVTLRFAANEVTFDNEGTEVAKVKAVHGSSIDNDDFDTQSMPADPVKDGFTFLGWNTAEDGSGDTFTGQSIISSDLTVYAQWKQDDPVDPVDPDTDPVNPVDPGTDSDSDKDSSSTNTAAKTSLAKTGDVVSDLTLALLASVAFGSMLLAAFGIRRKKQ